MLDDLPSENVFRPGLRRRGTGPPLEEEKAGHDDDWELSHLKERAEEAVSQLAEAVAGLHGEEDKELRRQLDQLQQFSPGSMGDDSKTEQVGLSSGKTKSNLANPCPPNLPLAILKLMEAYLVGLAEIPVEKGGWSEAKRERGLGMVKALSGQLSEAERLASSKSVISHQADFSLSPSTSHSSLLPPPHHLSIRHPPFSPLRHLRPCPGPHHAFGGMVSPRPRSFSRGSRRRVWGFGALPSFTDYDT